MPSNRNQSGRARLFNLYSNQCCAASNAVTRRGDRYKGCGLADYRIRIIE
jgi:hypothetical protein